MQVFIVGSPFDTAEALDRRRLSKQIVECGQILGALRGAKAWRNHPCVKQYAGHERWLEHYRDCLSFYARGWHKLAEIESLYAVDCYPVEWHCPEYFEQMKRRLYTKDSEHYSQWAHLGTSEENWYWSPDRNTFLKYRNGKQV